TTLFRSSGPPLDGRTRMSHRSLHLHLDAYLSVREALGFQMRAERTLLRDFVGFVEAHGDGGPIRAHLAVDWACASSAQRGRGGAAQRLSMARRFLAYLRATLPETEIGVPAVLEQKTTIRCKYLYRHLIHAKHAYL